MEEPEEQGEEEAVKVNCRPFRELVFMLQTLNTNCQYSQSAGMINQSPLHLAHANSQHCK